MERIDVLVLRRGTHGMPAAGYVAENVHRLDDGDMAALRNLVRAPE